MKRLSFRYCPICSKELDTGKAYFPAPHSILERLFAEGQYHSDKTTEKLKGHSIKELCKTYNKSFTVQRGADNPAGYCKECNRIFAEFNVNGGETLLTYDMDYYNESADNLYEDKLVSYHDDSDEKYDTIGGYTILTDNKKFNKSED